MEVRGGDERKSRRESGEDAVANLETLIKEFRFEKNPRIPVSNQRNLSPRLTRSNFNGNSSYNYLARPPSCASSVFNPPDRVLIRKRPPPFHHFSKLKISNETIKMGIWTGLPFFLLERMTLPQRWDGLGKSPKNIKKKSYCGHSSTKASTGLWRGRASLSHSQGRNPKDPTMMEVTFRGQSSLFDLGILRFRTGKPKFIQVLLATLFNN